MQKLSTDEYVFEVSQTGAAITVLVTQVSFQKTKTFHQACGTKLGMESHMNSMTDDLLKEWFKDSVSHKSKKPAK